MRVFSRLSMRVFSRLSFPVKKHMAMAQGYYTIEQWAPAKKGSRPEWVAVLRLPFGDSLTAAEKAIERFGKPGFYRIVQTQRVIWAELEANGLRLRKSHAGSPESLDNMRQVFDRTDGRYPIEEAREARRQVKKKNVRQRLSPGWLSSRQAGTMRAPRFS
jgi:hypothetical protein